MLNSLLIFAQASSAIVGQVPPATAPVAPVRTLQGLPNTTIEYYDVVGLDIASLRNSIASTRGITADNKPASPASATWTLGSKINQRNTGEKCTVTGAELNFGAKAVLPRLASREQVPAPVLAAWDGFVARLEAGTASNLWFIHDRIGTVQSAILASSCEGANAAATAAVGKLKQDEAEFLRRAAAAAAAEAAAAAAAAAAAKPSKPAAPAEQRNSTRSQ